MQFVYFSFQLANGKHCTENAPKGAKKPKTKFPKYVMSWALKAAYPLPEVTKNTKF